MKSKQIYFLSKVLFIFIISFIVTKLISQNVFLASTPKIQMNFHEKIITNIQKNFLLIKSSIIAFLFPTKQNKMNNFALDSIAQEARGSEKFLQFFNETSDVKEYHYSLSNGQKITIKIPKDIDKPPQKVIEELKNKKTN